MKNYLRATCGRAVLATILVVFASGFSGSAATLSVSPSIISNTYAGMVTLSIGELTNGEPVLVEEYLDGNANGVLDAGDMLWQSLQLTEGQMAIIGGATNWNVPGDTDGSGSSISAKLNFTASDVDQIVGQYAFRLSSPSGNFAAVTNLFQITNAAASQSVTGTVVTGSTPVPYSWVVLLKVGGAQDGEFYVGTMTDATGSYFLNVAPGIYQCLAGRPGYVYSIATGPVVTLATNTTVGTNLSLTPATRLLAGRAVDAGDTNAGLPGLFLVAPSTNGDFVIGTTDANGYFNLPVTAGRWELQADDHRVATKGCVRPQDWPGFDTTGGDVTNALLALSKGTALYYGTIKTDGNVPLPGTRLYGEDWIGHLYESDGLSDVDGNYAVAVLPGTWGISADSSSTSLRNFVVTAGTNSPIAFNQAIRVNFTAKPTTGRVSGWVRNSSGVPVDGVGVYSHSLIGGLNYSTWTATDGSGNYSLNVADGSWQMGLECYGDEGLESRGYECVIEQVVVVPPTNAVANFTVYPIGTPRLDPPAFTSPGQLYFALYGRPWTNYVVQVSTNLANPSAWSTLTSFTATNNVSTVWDYSATNRAHFYRAWIGP